MVSSEKSEFGLGIKAQCELLGLSRSSYYRENKPLRCDKLKGTKAEREDIEELNEAHPEYGARRVSVVLQSNDIEVGRKLARDLMKDLGLKAIYPKPNLSKPASDHQIYRYLLRWVNIKRF